MSAIRKLERDIAGLVLLGPPPTTVSTLATLAILDSRTLAVVPFADRDSDQLGQKITKQTMGAKQVSTTRSVITITI